MAEYTIAAAAKDQLLEVYAYGLENWGMAAADRYYNALFDRFEQIAAKPLLYPAVDYIRPNYRRSVCGENSIYYRVQGEIVEIVAILGGQDTETAL